MASRFQETLDSINETDDPLVWLLLVAAVLLLMV